MNAEMACLPAAPNGLEYVDLERSAQRGFENRLVGGPRALAVNVVRLCRPVSGRRAVAAGRLLAVTDVDEVALAPNLEIPFVGGDQLVEVATPSRAMARLNSCRLKQPRPQASRSFV